MATTTKWFLVQTEKAYTLQQNGVFVIAAMDKNYKTNKIELSKLLSSKGVKVTKITSSASYQKKKVRGRNRNQVTQFRPRKWFVKVEKGTVITDEMVQSFNQPVTK